MPCEKAFSSSARSLSSESSFRIMVFVSCMIKYIHLILYQSVVGESNHLRGPIPPHPKGWGLPDPLTPRVEELSRDCEESGYDCSQIPLPLDERIVVDPKIAHGKPIIRGTRVPVDVILGALAGGMQIDETAREYGISQVDVRAAIGYEAKIVSQEGI